MSSHDLDRLGQAVKARRIALRLTQRGACTAAGVARDTWRRIEQGEAVREMNYAKVEPVLNWAPESCVAILQGREAVIVTEVAGAPGAVKSVIPTEMLDDEVRDVVQLASIATTKGLTADEIRALSERVVQDLKKRGLI